LEEMKCLGHQSISAPLLPKGVVGLQLAGFPY